MICHSSTRQRINRVTGGVNSRFERAVTVVQMKLSHGKSRGELVGLEGHLGARDAELPITTVMSESIDGTAGDGGDTLEVTKDVELTSVTPRVTETTMSDPVDDTQEFADSPPVDESVEAGKEADKDVDKEDKHEEYVEEEHEAEDVEDEEEHEAGAPVTVALQPQQSALMSTSYVEFEYT